MSEGNIRATTEDISQKVGTVIADSTVAYRFGGELNTNQRKLATNMVLFPRMHFLSFSNSRYKPGISPFVSALDPKNSFLSNFNNS